MLFCATLSSVSLKKNGIYLLFPLKFPLFIIWYCSLLNSSKTKVRLFWVSCDEVFNFTWCAWLKSFSVLFLRCTHFLIRSFIMSVTEVCWWSFKTLKLILPNQSYFGFLIIIIIIKEFVLICVFVFYLTFKTKENIKQKN